MNASNIIPARRSDAESLARLINLAGEGIPKFLWQGICGPNESPLQVGTARAARDAGNFSYTNARVFVQDDVVWGMVLAYRQPDPYEVVSLEELPALVRPLVELEAQAPGSWYINAIATFEAYRRRGIGRQLMAACEQDGREAGCKEMSVIVARENAGALNLYGSLGFEKRAQLPILDYPGCTLGGDWMLLVKSL